jgi:hypothetical protein
MLALRASRVQWWYQRARAWRRRDNPATEDCGDYANQKRITARCVNAKAAPA